MKTWYRVVVHDADGLAAAIAAANSRDLPLEVWSAPGAALWQGPRWLWDLARAAGVERVVLDCGDAPGLALAALEAGVPAVAVAGLPAAARARLAAIAGERLVERPEGLGDAASLMPGSGADM